MMWRCTIDRADWDHLLEQMLVTCDVYASVANDSGQDYEQLTKDLISGIVYNTPKPSTPLKYFFLPFRENVSNPVSEYRKRIIIGIPNCDLEGLKLLDEIYLDGEYTDPFFKQKRENTILISTDCFERQKHCHCTRYGVKPFSEGNSDLSLAAINGKMIVTVFNEKGILLLRELVPGMTFSEDNTAVDEILDARHSEVIRQNDEFHDLLPDYFTTGILVGQSKDDIWKKYAARCVSCGACTTICPTCSCFLLIDKPGFVKVKQTDACQYPGFERVAGGEDALHRLFVRFRNRYLCKFVWKPDKFGSVACTGCGRCIEACIGDINKNDVFVELSKAAIHESGR